MPDEHRRELQPTGAPASKRIVAAVVVRGYQVDPGPKGAFPANAIGCQPASGSGIRSLKLVSMSRVGATFISRYGLLLAAQRCA